MTYDELIAVLQAAKAGKIIQSPTFCGNGEYADATDFSMQVDNLKFRIKPEPREIWLRDSDIPKPSCFSYVRVGGNAGLGKTPTEDCKVVKFVEVLE